MEEHYLDSIPPEAGLIELSSMYGLDFSRFRRDMRLADVAAEVKAQNVHWGSFEEILKTTDHTLTVEQFGRRFMTDRILVAGGTPKQIVDNSSNGTSRPAPMAASCWRAGFRRPAICRNSSIMWCRIATARADQKEIRGRDFARKSIAVAPLPEDEPGRFHGLR